MSLREKGQTLIEVIVAAAVGTLVVAALTFATIFSLRNASLAKNSAQATKLAQEGLEKVRTARDRDFDIYGNFTLDGLNYITKWSNGYRWSGQIRTQCLPICYFKIRSDGHLENIVSGSEEIGQFKRVVILSDEARDNLYQKQKIVTVIVTWKDTAGDHESRLTTILRKL